MVRMGMLVTVVVEVGLNRFEGRWQYSIVLVASSFAREAANCKRANCLSRGAIAVSATNHHDGRRRAPKGLRWRRWRRWQRCGRYSVRGDGGHRRPSAAAPDAPSGGARSQRSGGRNSPV